MKFITKITLIGILFVTTILACKFNRVNNNRPNDVETGKLFLEKFYQYIQNKSFDSLTVITSDTLKKIAGNNGVSKIAILVNTKAGNLKNYTVVNSFTQQNISSDEVTVYRFKVSVTYDRGVVDEEVGFEKINNTSLRVISYIANSDLLLR